MPGLWRWWRLKVRLLADRRSGYWRTLRLTDWIPVPAFQTDKNIGRIDKLTNQFTQVRVVWEALHSGIIRQSFYLEGIITPWRIEFILKYHDLPVKPMKEFAQFSNSSKYFTCIIASRLASAASCDAVRIAKSCCKRWFDVSDFSRLKAIPNLLNTA